MTPVVLQLTPGIEKLNPAALAGCLVDAANHIRDILDTGGAVDITSIYAWLSTAKEASRPDSDQWNLLTVAIAFLEAGFEPECKADPESEDFNTSEG